MTQEDLFDEVTSRVPDDVAVEMIEHDSVAVTRGNVAIQIWPHEDGFGWARVVDRRPNPPGTLVSSELDLILELV